MILNCSETANCWQDILSNSLANDLLIIFFQKLLLENDASNNLCPV